MAIMHAAPAVSSSTSKRLAHERRLQHALHALLSPGWRRRLTPLAQHMAQQHLVCACGFAAAPLRHLDLEALREALSRLLRQGQDEAYLIYQLVVEGIEPATVAAERGVSGFMLTEELRYAVRKLAIEYEATPPGRSLRFEEGHGCPSPACFTTGSLPGRRGPSLHRHQDFTRP